MSQPAQEQTRFNARLPKEQKLILERAARLGGYRNLTDFIMTAATERANNIIRENERIIASERDAEVFFNALANPAPPTAALQQAAAKYERFLKENESPSK